MKNTQRIFLLLMAAILMLAIGACTGGNSIAASSHAMASEPEAQTEVDVTYTLETSSQHGLTFVGIGGEIDGVVNPTLHAQPGDVVEITVIDNDGLLHDMTIDEFGVSTGQLTSQGMQKTVRFTVTEAGTFIYYCSIPGHRQAGMFGELVVGSPGANSIEGKNIVHNPADLPQPIGDRQTQTVKVDLTAEEVVGQLDDGTTYNYFTFNGTVPGPMIRARVGDTVEINLANADGNMFSHSIDLHAVTGPGGGHIFTETSPGNHTSFTFKALKPGLYVYHCATPSVAHHITNGMYGLILVEPEGGLPPVDHEYYVMQGEIYTAQPYGSTGQLDFDPEKLSQETPEYYVFNGADGALTQADNQLKAKVGDTIRIFFGVGGPNKTSSFHIIGEILDRAYDFGSLTSPPLTDVQTISVPPGGAWMVELQLEVPGNYILVDHALTRTERGLVGYLVVEDPEQPAIFHPGPAIP
jgi:nitrite reductase (NO-forming)